MKVFIFMLFIVLPVISNGQTYSSSVSDSEIISFLKWEVKNGKRYAEGGKYRVTKNVSLEIIPYYPENFIFSDSLNLTGWGDEFFLFKEENYIDSIFPESEQNFINSQFLSIKDSVWSHRILRAKWQEGKIFNNTYYYSIPLFSSDGQYVFIRKAFLCPGLCGYGGTYLYKKTGKNNWKLYRQMNGYVM